MRHIIGILLQNESGALSRVAGLFSSRGYNIESLSVSATDDPTLSRITLVTTGSEAVVHQIVLQLQKLIDVVAVDDQPGPEGAPATAEPEKADREPILRSPSGQPLVRNIYDKEKGNLILKKRTDVMSTCMVALRQSSCIDRSNSAARAEVPLSSTSSTTSCSAGAIM